MNANNNLDYLAAKHAQELVSANKKAKDLENTLTKTLGVLQENGVYACFLYLYASEKKKGSEVIAKMLALLKELQFPTQPEDTTSNQAVLEYVAKQITADLPRLLLAKEALEQMLIYARYGAKAQQKE